MFNVRLAGGHLYGKQLFTWLSLVVSLMASFVLSFFSLDVLDEIWDLIESVSEGFLTYSSYNFHLIARFILGISNIAGGSASHLHLHLPGYIYLLLPITHYSPLGWHISLNSLNFLLNRFPEWQPQ